MAKSGAYKGSIMDGTVARQPRSTWTWTYTYNTRSYPFLFTVHRSLFAGSHRSSTRVDWLTGCEKCGGLWVGRVGGRGWVVFTGIWLVGFLVLEVTRLWKMRVSLGGGFLGGLLRLAGMVGCYSTAGYHDVYHLWSWISSTSHHLF